jgi:hypothetical protein
VFWEISDEDGDGTKDTNLELPTEEPDEHGDFDVDFVKTIFEEGELKEKDLEGKK